ncbi:hypothetical protein E2562_018104 [Oryza meyeriana var. granulata]|uniref:Uncharacterized protein n=1 Tax=Oryza meyeriana var. granulata TaxID=110450 RepID=A0A6G1CRX7_9ORYZ|nr:hypothetical protein E2562_018104 [Oryza meyeriana var. granulata]
MSDGSRDLAASWSSFARLRSELRVAQRSANPDPDLLLCRQQGPPSRALPPTATPPSWIYSAPVVSATSAWGNRLRPLFSGPAVP